MFPHVFQVPVLDQRVAECYLPDTLTTAYRPASPTTSYPVYSSPPMISYAQNFEDVLLWRALREVKSGRYVDVGAFHPEFDSVTKWFYDQGWCGVNVEPVPESFALLEAARPRDCNVRAAAGAQPGTAWLKIIPGSPGLSALCPSPNGSTPETTLHVEVLPLRQILEPYAGQPIHFLKIDAEGSEREVLLGMDFKRFRPWIVVVEATVPTTDKRNAHLWQDIMLSSDYLYANFDGLNEYYVAAEKAELAPKLAVPANVFDEFELAVTAREREAFKALQDEVGPLKAELDSTQAAIKTLSSEMGVLAAAAKGYREQLQLSRNQLQQILNSKSWRLMEPARRLRRILLPRR